MSRNQRDVWLESDDATLLAHCDIDTYRASGPGGQKRNKTSSAVRLRHGPSGLTVIAEESRSQHENKAKALRRLRMAIALQLRAPIADDWQPPDWTRDYIGERTAGRMSDRNPLYPQFAALLLDLLAHRNGQASKAAAILGVSTSQFTKLLALDGKLLAEANSIRKQLNLGPLN